MEINLRIFKTNKQTLIPTLQRKIIFISSDVRIYPTHLPRAGCDKINFQAEYGWFEFGLFLLTKAKELSRPYYLSIAGKRYGFMPFLRAFARRETQGFDLELSIPFSISVDWDCRIH